MRTTRRRPAGFTLVELLVVIGIIGLLISILLPSLNAARAAANNVKCLSNLRQMVTAATMQQSERRTMQPVSDLAVLQQIDASHRKYMWIENPDPAAADKSLPMDWISAMLPYLVGGKGSQQTKGLKVVGNMVEFNVLRCPADRWQVTTGDLSNPAGYYPGPNALVQRTDGTISLVGAGTSGTDYVPVSYGINLDITCAVTGGEAKYMNGNTLGVYRGRPAYSYDTKYGQSLGGRLDRVQGPAEVMLFSDCGVRPPNAWTYAADRADALTFTTNYMAGSGDPTLWGTLEGVIQTGHLRGRFPLDRHDRNMRQNGDGSFNWTKPAGRLNVAFADGHCEGVTRQEFARVRVSPFR